MSHDCFRNGQQECDLYSSPRQARDMEDTGGVDGNGGDHDSDNGLDNGEGQLESASDASNNRNDLIKRTKIRRFSNAGEYDEKESEERVPSLMSRSVETAHQTLMMRRSVGTVYGILTHETPQIKRGQVMSVDISRSRTSFVKSASYTGRSTDRSTEIPRTTHPTPRMVVGASTSKYECISSYSLSVPQWADALLTHEPNSFITPLVPLRGNSTKLNAEYAHQRYGCLSSFMHRSAETVRLESYFKARVHEECRRNFLNVHTCKGTLQVRRTV
jgi:hypothetical protein